MYPTISCECAFLTESDRNNLSAPKFLAADSQCLRIHVYIKRPPQSDTIMKFIESRLLRVPLISTTINLRKQTSPSAVLRTLSCFRPHAFFTPSPLTPFADLHPKQNRFAFSPKPLSSTPPMAGSNTPLYKNPDAPSASSNRTTAIQPPIGFATLQMQLSAVYQ